MSCGDDPSAGTTAVRGSWLPPGISVVFASGATPDDGASSRSDPDSGGANTVAGSGTDASSAPEFTSVPVHGVAPAGTAAAGVAGTPSLAVGSYGISPPRRSGTASAAPGTGAGAGPDSTESASEAAADTASEAGAAGAAAAAGRGAMPARSAASCSHSGGLSMNDVCSESIRGGGTEASEAAVAAAAPYSSSYRRITSPTGSPGHNVTSPLSRAMTSR